MRLTKEGKETSRDARLALLDAIAIHAQPRRATELLPLLQDFDPKVADRAARIVIELTGRTARTGADAARPRGWPQEFTDLRQCVTVTIGAGGSFRDGDAAGERADRGGPLPQARDQGPLLRRPHLPPRRPELRHPGRQPGRERVRGAQGIHARRGRRPERPRHRSACRRAAATPATRSSSSTSWTTRG